jgi:erythronate-4-phosphate dehydrogenase
VVSHLDTLGFDVIQYDPLRAANESDFVSTPLSHFADRDLVCVHTPLTFEGPYKTHHLVDEAFIVQQKPGSVILNAARGAVVDFAAVKTVGRALTWCLDVWEHEPDIDCDVLQQAVIATPHVAGYAVESKHRGTRQVYAAACKALGWLNVEAASCEREPRVSLLQTNWQERVLSVYDPAVDTQFTKETLLAPGIDVAKAFDDLRAHYPVRHEL